MEIKLQSNVDRKLFLLIFTISFVIFVFTSDAHRYTLDEAIAQEQSKRIVTQQPHPDYVEDESHLYFDFHRYKMSQSQPICFNGVLCSGTKIVHSITQAPFIFINQIFNIITKENVVYSSEDFSTVHYVWWRNSLDPDFTFLELFYGPLFSALTVGIFFLMCRILNFSQKISVILALLLGLTTMLWAYSQTSLNSVPATFFNLLGFFFFIKFLKNGLPKNLVFCGLSYGLAFLTREDVVIFVVILFVFLLHYLRNEREKLKKLSSFVLPLAAAYGVQLIINFVRFRSVTVSSPTATLTTGGGVDNIFASHSYPLYEGGFGLLLSPGVGLFIFVPILITIFLSFPDFYTRNKRECVLILSIVGSFLIFYGTSGFWHGLVGWGPRYLLPIIPFLLLPLGASIEKRKSRIFKTSIVTLGAAGMFFNLVYLVQDVPFFVWGWPFQSGLYGIDMQIDGLRNSLNLDPAVMWTFQYSQLIHSIIRAFTFLEHDIFLLKVLSPMGFVISFVTLISPPVYFLINIMRKSAIYGKTIKQNHKDDFVNHKI